jgi:T5orf172 domain
MIFVREEDGSLRPRTDAERRRPKTKPIRTAEEVERDLADTRPRIYLIRSGFHGRYFKIGWCNGNVRLRIAHLQVGNPIELFLVQEWIVEHAPIAAMEREIHAQLKHRAVRGEWFRGIMTEMVEIVDGVLWGGIHEPKTTLDAKGCRTNSGSVPLNVLNETNLISSNINTLPG